MLSMYNIHFFSFFFDCSMHCTQHPTFVLSLSLQKCNLHVCIIWVILEQEDHFFFMRIIFNKFTPSAVCGRIFLGMFRISEFQITIVGQNLLESLFCIFLGSAILPTPDSGNNCLNHYTTERKSRSSVFK